MESRNKAKPRDTNKMEAFVVKMSNVKEVLSQCQMFIKSVEFSEAKQILPYCSDILSEMYNLVQSVSAVQQQQQTDFIDWLTA